MDQLVQKVIAALVVLGGLLCLSVVLSIYVLLETRYLKVEIIELRKRNLHHSHVLIDNDKEVTNVMVDTSSTNRGNSSNTTSSNRENVSGIRTSIVLVIKFLSKCKTLSLYVEWLNSDKIASMQWSHLIFIKICLKLMCFEKHVVVVFLISINRVVHHCTCIMPSLPFAGTWKFLYDVL